MEHVVNKARRTNAVHMRRGKFLHLGCIRANGKGFGTMVEYALITLFALVTIATGLALVDCWLRGKHAFVQIIRERALLNSGFVPMIGTQTIQLRRASKHNGFARHLPQRRVSRPRSEPVPALFAA